jgi:hypothetical protein
MGDCLSPRAGDDDEQQQHALVVAGHRQDQGVAAGSIYFQCLPPALDCKMHTVLPWIHVVLIPPSYLRRSEEGLEPVSLNAAYVVSVSLSDFQGLLCMSPRDFLALNLHLVIDSVCATMSI